MPEPARVAGLALVLAALALLTVWQHGAILTAERGAVACCGAELAVVGAYLEESGGPMPVPAEVSISYLGDRAAHAGAGCLVAAWAGLTLVVVLGATNLFALSRLMGRRPVTGRVGAVLQLTPRRLARAARWFGRWGPLATALSRCVPGLRFPMAVACGALGVSYRGFWAGTAPSAAIWVAGFLALGVAVRRSNQIGLRPNATTNVCTVRYSLSSFDIRVTRSRHSSADTARLIGKTSDSRVYSARRSEAISDPILPPQSPSASAFSQAD